MVKLFQVMIDNLDYLADNMKGLEDHKEVQGIPNHQERNRFHHSQDLFHHSWLDSKGF